MADQFARTRLLFGDEGIDALGRAHVALFGLGGVGGHAAEALVRTGLGAIDLIDDDAVEPSNINRQIIATWDGVGCPKTDLMRSRLLSINPGCRIEVHRCFYLPETAGRFDLASYDYIIDAVDTVTAKLELVERARAAGTPIISAMGAGNRTDPTAVRIADISRTSVCPLARVMRRELRKRGIETLKVAYSPEPPRTPSGGPGESAGHLRETRRKSPAPGSNAFVPAAMGLAIAAEVAKDLMERAKS